MLDKFKITLVSSLVFFLTACGGVSGPSLNVDNDFWFGSAGDVTVGLGFAQSGSSVSAGLAYIDSGGRARACCTLRGSLNGYTLLISDRNSSGDTLTLSARFNSAGTRLTGTLTAVVDGRRVDNNVDMRYESELSTRELPALSDEVPMTIAELAALIGTR